MTDTQLLSVLAEQLRQDTALPDAARAEYQNLIKRFPEDGFEIELRYQPDEMTNEQEEYE